MYSHGSYTEGIMSGHIWMALFVSSGLARAT